MNPLVSHPVNHHRSRQLNRQDSLHDNQVECRLFNHRVNPRDVLQDNQLFNLHLNLQVTLQVHLVNQARSQHVDLLVVNHR